MPFRNDESNRCFLYANHKKFYVDILEQVWRSKQHFIEDSESFFFFLFERKKGNSNLEIIDRIGENGFFICLMDN